ncbi:flagellar biosynthesis regulator FlaF [Aliiroseovarius crassostreae]|uniref:flagellar biosynthesis regulator FlaF n=1 Tax=Aliiroseovarius crassostreae TaxID=154981 RepID=UPI003C7AAEBE
MNMAKTAYAASQTPIRTPRSIEYEAFARVTHHIKSSAEKGRAGFVQLSRAVHENRRLWTLLATDVAEQGNTLPPDLRAKIFYLAEFTNLQSSKVLKDPTEAKVLVEINTAIMRGLRQKAEVA